MKGLVIKGVAEAALQPEFLDWPYHFRADGHFVRIFRFSTSFVQERAKGFI